MCVCVVSARNIPSLVGNGPIFAHIAFETSGASTAQISNGDEGKAGGRDSAILILPTTINGAIATRALRTSRDQK